MPELNESTEMTNELIMDSVKGDEAERELPKWHSWVGLSTLLMATLTAVGALLSGYTAHEALLERTEEIIAVSVSQGVQVSVEVLKSKHEILTSVGSTPDKAEIAEIQAYDNKVEALNDEIDRDETSVRSVMHTHLVFAIAVTLLAIGISLSGMAIIVEQRLLWYAGIVFGIIGAIGLGIGIVLMLFS